MFAGLFGSAVGVNLSEDAAAGLAALPGAGSFGLAERPMGGYLSLPADMHDEEAAAWFDRAREHVATFPPKQKR